jgi:hypothetical protein
MKGCMLVYAAIAVDQNSDVGPDLKGIMWRAELGIRYMMTCLIFMRLCFSLRGFSRINDMKKPCFNEAKRLFSYRYL